MASSERPDALAALTRQFEAYWHETCRVGKIPTVDAFWSSLPESQGRALSNDERARLADAVDRLQHPFAVGGADRGEKTVAAAVAKTVSAGQSLRDPDETLESQGTGEQLTAVAFDESASTDNARRRPSARQAFATEVLEATGSAASTVRDGNERTIDVPGPQPPGPRHRLGSHSFSWDPDENGPPSGPTVPGAPAVDGYRILRELGRGGMGVVYHARHRGLKREVALKMILAGVHAVPEQLDRFRAEAEAVARLQHPNVVQIYDVGEQDGLPFFSLEFVDGMPLDKFLDGKPQLPDAAAEMLETLARAIDHAHSQGIVHRDLKPANVLLTKDGVPKITDFGLVKRLEVEDAGQTRTGTIMGTPSYMAPEQGRGAKDVGPLADVYALGSMLYAMLTGRPPFLGATIFDTLLQLLNSEPVAPSKLQPKTPRDLETICLKCLEKDPARRYARASDLADDLQRFRRREPITARAVGPVERSWRWCVRNPLVASLLTLAAALALIVLIGAPIAAVRIGVERNDAVAARDLAQSAAIAARAAQASAEQERENAEANERRAQDEKQRADKNAQAADAQRQLALGALETLVTEVQNQLDDTARTYQLKQSLLNTAFEGLRRVTAGGDLALQEADATMAEAHQRMGRIFMELGRAEAARDEYAAALEIMQRLQQGQDSPQLRYDLSRAATRLADACLLLGDFSQAEPLAQQAVDLRLALAREYPTPDVYKNLARAYVKLGDVRHDQGQSEPARQQFLRALGIQEQLAQAGDAQQQADLRADLLNTCEKLGDLFLLRLQDAQSARSYYQRALVEAEALVEANPTSFRQRQTLAVVLKKLGNASLQQADRSAASQYYERSLELLRVLAAEEDAGALLVQGELALVLARAGRHEEAARKAEELREISPEYARNLYNVACCFALCAEAVDRAETPAEPDSRQLRQRYAELAIQALQDAARFGLANADFVSTDPDLQSIRNAPQFEQLIQQLAR